MIHPTYVISLSPQTKWYMLIWLKYLIPPTCLKSFYKNLKYYPDLVIQRVDGHKLLQDIDVVQLPASV